MLFQCNDHDFFNDENHQTIQRFYNSISRDQTGTYGVVLKCRDKESGEYVAIKQFKENDRKFHIVEVILKMIKLESRKG